MHRVIVPIDFSETSLNAANFTGQMLSGKKDAMVYLYHNFSHHNEAATSAESLENIRKDLLAKGISSVECITEYGGDLIDNLTKLAEVQRASLFIMGITGRSGLSNIFMGSNTLKMVEQQVCPVMIVPPS